MKNQDAYDLLLDAKELLVNILYAMENDKDFPMVQDFADLAKAKVNITKAVFSIIIYHS